MDSGPNKQGVSSTQPSKQQAYSKILENFGQNDSNYRYNVGLKPLFGLEILRYHGSKQVLLSSVQTDLSPQNNLDVVQLSISNNAANSFCGKVTSLLDFQYKDEKRQNEYSPIEKSSQRLMLNKSNGSGGINQQSTSNVNQNGSLIRFRKLKIEDLDASDLENNMCSTAIGHILTTSKLLKGVIMDLCFQTCKVSKEIIKKDNLRNQNGSSKEIFSMVSFPIDSIIEMSMRNQTESIKVQKYLEIADQRTLECISLEFKKHCDALVCSSSGSFVASFLVSHSPFFKHECERYCLYNVKWLVWKKSAMKVMQALAEVSKSFCNGFSRFFQLNYSKLRSSKNATMLMSLVIPEIDDVDSLDFILDDLSISLQDLSQFPSAEMLRLLSNILVRCDIRKLENIIEGVLRNIRWLFGDKIGNYSVQALLSPKFQEYHPLLLCKLLDPENIECILMNKYKRIVILRSLEMKAKPQNLHDALISAIINSEESMQQILSEKTSSYVLTALLSSTNHANRQRWVLSFLRRLLYKKYSDNVLKENSHLNLMAQLLFSLACIHLSLISFQR